MLDKNQDAVKVAQCREISERLRLPVDRESLLEMVLRIICSNILYSESYPVGRFDQDTVLQCEFVDCSGKRKPLFHTVEIGEKGPKVELSLEAMEFLKSVNGSNARGLSLALIMALAAVEMDHSTGKNYVDAMRGECFVMDDLPSWRDLPPFK